MDAMILLYHGVTSAKSVGIENCSGKHMAADEFDRQMAAIAGRARPLREVAKSGGIAVTFDDSYRNVFTDALPILKRHGVPATFFIATGFIETGAYYWTDILEHNIQRGDGSQAEKIERLTAIKRRLKASDPATRRAAMDGMSTEGMEAIPNYQSLSWDEVRALDSAPLFEVGGHSVTHEILSLLDAA